ncbi:hypothetical protein ACIBG8_27670 [Nonomuraea sp. NPDC050556]|uniref:hypothetical protein n=1 Tax=Nonomuraea sp. NPDC050556 TaxID=3364369 RepID=UPI003794C61A
MKKIVVFALSALLLLSASPAAAEGPKPLTKAQLKAALLTPKDLGGGFRVVRPKRADEKGLPIGVNKTSQACLKAYRALKPLWSGVQGTVSLQRNHDKVVDKQVDEAILTGTAAQLKRWESAAATLEAECPESSRTEGSYYGSLDAGTYGDATYALHLCWHYDQNGDNTDCDAVGVGIFQNLVIIRVKSAIIGVVHTGYNNYDEHAYDPEYIKEVAEKAAAKLTAVAG